MQPSTAHRDGVVTVNLDRMVHEPARLSILTNLFIVEDANATFLLRQTGLTWGNLGSHLARLEAVGYVDITKGYEGKQPQTTISITPRGRAALLDYRAQLIAALDPIAG
jgi:DNA-binding MarR family transcriptional regulator